MNKAIINSLCMVCLLTITGSLKAQQVIPFKFTSEDENKLIKENDSLKYYAATDDTGHIVTLNEENNYYKLLTRRDKKLITDGAFVIEGDKYYQDGKWTERYENGKVKTIGYFIKGKPVGTWQDFYNTGKLHAVYNYGVFIDKGDINSGLSGTYQEYYPSGKLKTNGIYGVTMAVYYDTVVVNDPVSGGDVKKVIKHRSLNAEKTGTWEQYTEAGELEQKDKDKNKDEKKEDDN